MRRKKKQFLRPRCKIAVKKRWEFQNWDNFTDDRLFDHRHKNFLYPYKLFNNIDSQDLGFS